MRVAVWREDRGVVGGIAAMCLAVFLGMSALVIDVGNSWQQRRTAVTATDAAALAAAQDFLFGSNGCISTAEHYLLANESDATLTECVHVAPSGDTPGRVTVAAEMNVTYIFAPIVGIDSGSVGSSTTVWYGAASGIRNGLRPFALCLDSLGDLGVVPGDGTIYRIPFDKDNEANCGGEDIPGNWGIMDYDGGSNSQADINEWTLDGYAGGVDIDDVIEGNTGAFNNSSSAPLNFLESLDSFPVPVYSTVSGNGSNAVFTIANFASVRLHGFRTTGAQKHRYLDLEFLDAVFDGHVGGPNDDLGAFAIGICAVDGIAADSACT